MNWLQKCFGKKEAPRQDFGITGYLMKKTTALEKLPEVSPGYQHYAMFNAGGVEVEVGEFLYAFVKMIKPKRILETGTHLGVSSLYMAQALKENGAGHLVTLEIFDENIQKSKRLWREAGVAEQVTVLKARSLEYTEKETLDMLFLDSEPDIRFDELVRFYDKVRPEGFIFVHDLHPHLGRSGPFLHEMPYWPYGDFREKFGDRILDYSLQTFSFRTPRGFTLFQKTGPEFGHYVYLQEARRAQDKGSLNS